MPGLKEQLQHVIATTDLHNEDPEKTISGASLLVKAYLWMKQPEYERAAGLMMKGWRNQEGDKVFRAQRKNADDATVEMEGKFHKMMVVIAEQMEASVGALSPPGSKGETFEVLDICMAPGGFTEAVLRRHAGARCYGVTLPSSAGGHAVVGWLEKDRRVERIYKLDVTLLRELAGGKPILKQHPDYNKFSSTKPCFYNKNIHLIFCDGLVLRTHKREGHRHEKGKETTRLATSQLILALTRIQRTGTIIMLLHKLDSWHTAHTIHQFSKFSTVSLFKPDKSHKTRSSFYMIAQNVDTEAPAFKEALEQWREDWYRATCGGENGTGEASLEPEEGEVLEMLEGYGEALVGMSKRLWKIQGDALANTKYAGEGTGGASWK